jgi:hypothetical protein
VAVRLTLLAPALAAGQRTWTADYISEKLTSGTVVLFGEPGAGKSAIISCLREWSPPCSDPHPGDLSGGPGDPFAAALLGDGEWQRLARRLVSAVGDLMLLLALLSAMEVTAKEPAGRAPAARARARSRGTRSRGTRGRTRSRRMRHRRVLPGPSRPCTPVICAGRRRKPAQLVSCVGPAVPVLVARALIPRRGRGLLAGSPDPCLPAVTEGHWGAVSS